VGDLAAFLNARLDDDEWTATGAARCDDGRHGDWYPASIAAAWLTITDARVDDHIARHDPARVLREVAAKRAILAAYEEQDGYDLPDGVAEGRDPEERERDEALRDALETVILAIAAVYSDHPDYDPAWK